MSWNRAVAFALSTGHLPTAAAQPTFLLRTLDLLRANGQPHLAAEVLGLLVADNVPGPDLYARWCRLLYEQQRWSDLAAILPVKQALDTEAECDHQGLFPIDVASSLPSVVRGLRHTIRRTRSAQYPADFH